MNPYPQNYYQIESEAKELMKDDPTLPMGIALRMVKAFNENHDDKGQFSSGEWGGSSTGSQDEYKNADGALTKSFKFSGRTYTIRSRDGKKWDVAMKRDGSSPSLSGYLQSFKSRKDAEKFVENHSKEDHRWQPPK